jgi:hypothetical protein
VTYFGESGILLIKMAATEHESAVVAEGDGFRDQLVKMGLAACISRIGVPRINSIHPNTAAKEPDDGLIPILARPTGNHFPTLVFEVANTQQLRSVRQAKDWWFANSADHHERGGVNYVLLTRLSQDYLGTIHFELWQRGLRRPQKATICLKSSDNPPSVIEDPSLWSWSGLPIRVQFQDLLLRPKQGQEKDVELTADLAVRIATRV